MTPQEQRRQQEAAMSPVARAIWQRMRERRQQERGDALAIERSRSDKLNKSTVYHKGRPRAGLSGLSQT